MKRNFKPMSTMEEAALAQVPGTKLVNKHGEVYTVITKRPTDLSVLGHVRAVGNGSHPEGQIFGTFTLALYKENKPRNTFATTESYLAHVAANTPSEQGNIDTEQFLSFAETVTGIYITCHPDNEQYAIIKKRYEGTTGDVFTATAPDPKQGPKCDTILSMKDAVKSGYPICEDKGDSLDAPLYLTKLFDDEDVAHVQGRRAGVVWALRDLGYVIGNNQDRALISARIAEARKKL